MDQHRSGRTSRSASCQINISANSTFVYEITPDERLAENAIVKIECHLVLSQLGIMNAGDEVNSKAVASEQSFYNIERTKA